MSKFSEIIDFIKSLPKWGRRFSYAGLLLVLMCILVIFVVVTYRIITGQASIKYGNLEFNSSKEPNNKTNPKIDYSTQRDTTIHPHIDSQAKNAPIKENITKPRIKNDRGIKQVSTPINNKDNNTPVKNDIHAKNVAIGDHNKVGDEIYNITNTNQPRQLTKIVANKILREIDSIRVVNNIKSNEIVVRESTNNNFNCPYVQQIIKLLWSTKNFKVNDQTSRTGNMIQDSSVRFDNDGISIIPIGTDHIVIWIKE